MRTDDTFAQSFEDELRALLAAGQKIEAIRRYREQMGAGLAEAKAAVEALERSDESAHGSAATAGFEPELLRLLEQGRKIDAIRLYRERTGAGLKEAKDAVEALAVERGLAVPKAGCLGMLALIVLF